MADLEVERIQEILRGAFIPLHTAIKHIPAKGVDMAKFSGRVVIKGQIDTVELDILERVANHPVALRTYILGKREELEKQGSVLNAWEEPGEMKISS